jgi:hypothetical protein
VNGRRPHTADSTDIIKQERYSRSLRFPQEEGEQEAEVGNSYSSDERVGGEPPAAWYVGCSSAKVITPYIK